MNIILLGEAGFIGNNLTLKLTKDDRNNITLLDKSRVLFSPIKDMNLSNVTVKESSLEVDADFDELLVNQEVVYHLVSSTVPTTSNRHISQELIAKVVFSANLLDVCVRNNVKKVELISSGGTVYGHEDHCPIKEDDATSPISSYGIQKITIEFFYLYQYLYD
jgi:UDP-glucose 4-epimerase